MTAGTAEVVVGDGTPGFSGDKGPMSAAQLNFPTGIDVNDNGLLVIADGHNNRIRVVNLNPSGTVDIAGQPISAGNIQTIAGSGPASTSAYPNDNGPGLYSGHSYQYALAVKIDRPAAPTLVDGRVFFTEIDNRRVELHSGNGHAELGIYFNVHSPHQSPFGSLCPKEFGKDRVNLSNVRDPG